MKKLKVIQIGTEHDHASSSMGSLRRQDDLFEVAGFVMPEEDTASVYEKNKAAYEGLPILSLEEAFAVEGLEGAVIETSDKFLTKYARIAVEHGLAVQMDKPGGGDADEFDLLADEAEKAGKGFQMGYMYRFNPAILALYDAVKKGELGDILYINAEMNCIHPAEKRRWLGDYPGGMMHFLGCHLVDIIYRLQGEPEEVIALNQPSGLDGVSADDEGFAVFRYPAGVSFARTTAVEKGGFRRRQIVVVGSKATWEINPTEYYRLSGETKDMLTDTFVRDSDNWNDPGVKSVSETYNRYDDMFRSYYQISRGEKTNDYTLDYEKKLYRLVLKACGKN